MVQIGKVIVADGESATVEVRRASACGENCAQCGGMCLSTGHRATVKNAVGAAAGDMVKIETPDRSVLKSACCVYLLPVLILFVCFGVGELLSVKPGVSAALGIFGLCAGFFILRALDRRLAPTPEIVQILYQEGGEEEWR